MNYYLGDVYDDWKTAAPDVPDPLCADDILDAAQDNTPLFERIEEEVYERRYEDMTTLHKKCFTGVDIRTELDSLFEEVVNECLDENIDYFRHMM